MRAAGCRPYGHISWSIASQKDLYPVSLELALQLERDAQRQISFPDGDRRGARRSPREFAILEARERASEMARIDRDAERAYRVPWIDAGAQLGLALGAEGTVRLERRLEPV